jgi:hypothetical protein
MNIDLHEILQGALTGYVIAIAIMLLVYVVWKIFN